ncbi:MAG: class I SAM-dependent DNA methyltransferase [Candidatus Hermodarchaeota archaeon]
MEDERIQEAKDRKNFRATAESLLEALKKEKKQLIEFFVKAGFKTQREYIFPTDDTLIYVAKEQINPREIIKDWQKGNEEQREFKWVIILHSSKIIYYFRNKELKSVSLKITGSKGRKREKERIIEHLSSLIALGKKYTPYNAKIFAFQYGQYSLSFFYAFDRLKQYFQQNQCNKLKKIFEEWKKCFNKVYQDEKATLELFLKHTYLALLIQLVIIVTYFGEHNLKAISVKERTNWVKKYQDTLFSYNFFNWALEDTELLENVLSSLKTPEDSNDKKKHSYVTNFQLEDIFSTIYQQMISPSTRQALGEFYTPPELARIMVEDFYEFGKMVLDPACGSGTFIVEIMKKILLKPNKSLEQKLNALKNIFGMDINPIAVATTRANVMLQLRKLVKTNDKMNIIKNLVANISLRNALFPKNDGSNTDLGKVDLVIGNPPWLVLNRIHDSQYKEQLKDLAREMEIVPAPHQLSQLEISALFLYRVKHYLKNGGNIFFIVSNGFMTGNNHAGTRQFNEFDDIRIWKFTKDIFNIHSICISLKYVQGLKRTPSELKDIHIQVTNLDPTHSNSKTVNFTRINEELYLPYDVENKLNHPSSLVKKLIPKTQLNSMLPLGPNAYRDIFYNGATLYPRNLIFVKVYSKDKEFCEIRPVISNAKKPWDFNPLHKLGLQTVKVEKKFIFYTLKSTDLVPFAALRTSEVFLPIKIDKETGGYSLVKDSKTLGEQYFENLNQLYKAEQKKGATIRDLWQNLDYQGKLTSSRQRSPIKVVMMGRGSLVKACILRQREIIIDNANYFISLENEDEAYYVLAFLNSPSVTKTVQIIQDEGAGGKGRNIHKRPLEIRLPKFNSNNKSHRVIVEKAKEMEEKTQNIVRDWVEQERKRVKKKAEKEATKETGKFSDDTLLRSLTLQNKIYLQLGWDDRLKGDYAELDKLIRQLIVK